MAISWKIQKKGQHFQPLPGFQSKPLALYAVALTNWAMDTDYISRGHHSTVSLVKRIDQ